MAKKRTRGGSGSDRYKKLLDKIDGMDLGSDLFWSPPVGRSVIRILPPVGDMGDFFFVTVGQHYIDNKNTLCPAMCTDGEKDCPACDVNEELYQGGEVEAAKRFRVNRRFYMNIIVRGEEAAGPRIFTPGVQVFSSITAIIGDPDYGEVYDLDEGTDINIDRTGTGIETEYQVMPKRNYSELGDEEQIEEWLEEATDLVQHVAGRLQSYEEVAQVTGADKYLELDMDDVGTADDDDDDDERFDDEDEDEEETASAAISRRLARRQQATGKRERRRSRRR